MTKRILLVDDEPQLLFSVKEYLQRVGYEVTPAGDGMSALEEVMDSPPDLIVSDVLMERMDGFEFQERVNALTGQSIPFIFLTAKSDVQDRVEALQSGADDYVLKPFEPEELAARIQAILHRIEQTRQEERRELDRLRCRILSRMSRELRAPVAGITTRLNLLLTERFGRDKRSQERYLQNVLEDANSLRELVDDLSWAAADAGEELRLELEPTRVAPIIRCAAANAARLASKKSIKLKIKCGGLLNANLDSTAMTRALAGLLESAVEISPVGSLVAISARRAEDGGLEFTIRDEGCEGDQGNDELDSEWSAEAMTFARRVVKAHGGKFAVSHQDSQLQIVLWLPGRIAKYVNREG